MDRSHRSLFAQVLTGDDLALHRHDIDRIDRTIVALLVERTRIALAAGEIKRELGQPVRSASREAEVLSRVRRAVAGPLDADAAERIFRAIIDETATCQMAGCARPHHG